MEQIAQDNRLQFRVVELVDRWWQHDSGPLVGTIEASGEPCALIPTGGKYILHAGGKARTVDRKVAGEIGRIGYSFYVPFPDGKLTPWRILKFGVHRGKGEVVTIALTLFLAGLFSLGLAAPAQPQGAVLPQLHRR
jgi:hypothetical protein